MGVTLISLSTIYLVYERLWPRAVGGGLAAMGPACNRSICPALARSSGDAAAARVEERDSLQEHEFAFLPRRRERARSLVAAGLCDTVERADKDTTDHK